jgi:hypothetical protein
MPLHVDRTSVQAHQRGHGHVLDRAAARGTDETGETGETGHASADAAVLKLAGVAAGAASDVSSVDEADRLVRTLLAQHPGAAISAHSSLDPARIQALLAS